MRERTAREPVREEQTPERDGCFQACVVCNRASARLVLSRVHVHSSALSADIFQLQLGCSREIGVPGGRGGGGGGLTETALSLRAREIERVRVHFRKVRRVCPELLAQACKRRLHRGECVCPAGVAFQLAINLRFRPHLRIRLPGSAGARREKEK